MHEGISKPASHIRRKRKIDYFLLTPGAMDFTATCGIETFGESVNSNHRGMFLNFDAVALFGDTTPDLMCMTTKILTSHISFYVRKY